MLPSQARAAPGKELVAEYHVDEGEKVMATVSKFLKRHGVKAKAIWREHYCSPRRRAWRVWVAVPENTPAKGKRAASGTTVSRLALAITLLFAGTPAFAANECGVEAVGQDSITCSSANYAGGSTYPNYPAGIQYTNSDGLTLTLNDAAGSIGNPGVWLTSSASVAGDVSVIGTNVGNITTSIADGYALWSRIIVQSATATGAPTATVRLTAGTIVVSGSDAVGLYAWSQARAGAALARMDGGTVTTAGLEGYGVLSAATTVSSTATSTSVLTAGSINTSGTSGIGVYSLNAGLGASLSQMDGGTIATSGQGGYGMSSFIGRASSTATATSLLTAGIINTTGGLGQGVRSSNNGLGNALAQMSGGTITTSGESGFGVISRVGNASSSALATARLTAGTINVSGTFGIGAYALNSGLGAALAQMEGGTVTTTGGSGRGLLASSNSGLASVNHTGGTVAATGLDSDGIRASSTSGDVTVTAASTVTGGSGAGTAINTFTALTKLSTINVQSTAVLAAASGIAIQNNLGNSNVTISPGASVTGAITLDTGTDNLTINGTGLSGITVMNGGDDVLAADGWVDTLTLNAVNASLVAENIQNWERINLVGSAATLAGAALTTGAGAPATMGLAIDGGSTLSFAEPAFAITGDVSQLGTLDLRGAAPGRALNLTGNYYGNGGQLLVNLATADGGDRLNVTGGVNLNGTSLALSGAYYPALGDIFTVVTNDGTDPVVGTFAGLAQGAAVQHNGAWLTISYTAGTGNDIVLTTVFGAPQSSRPGGYAIPTLSQWGTLLLGTLLAAGAMLGLRRRKLGGCGDHQ